jgi:hypothetical protein
MSIEQRYQVSIGSPYAVEKEAGTTDRSATTFTYLDWITPLYISYGSNGGLGILQCRCAKAPEDAYPLIKNGVPIQVTDTKGVSDPSSKQPIVFDGIIQKVNYKISGVQTEFAIIAYCSGDDLLRRICLHGQIRLSHDKEENLWDEGVTGSPEAVSTTIADDDIVRVDTPLIFNPGGDPNMSKQEYNVDGDGSTKVNVFDVPFRNQHGPGGELKSQFWTLKRALKYLFSFENADWVIATSSWNDDVLDNFFDEYGDPIITNINLEGKPFLVALDVLLTPHNFIFYVDPIPDPDSGKQKLHINFKGSGEDVKQLVLSSKGTNVADSKANLINLDLTEDCTSVVNNLLALGDQKVFTTLAHSAPKKDDTTLKLSQGWETTDLKWAYNGDGTVNTYDLTFRKNYCHPVGVDEKGVGGVGRLWIVNLGEVKSSDLEDLTKKLNDTTGTTNGYNSINPRRLEKPEIYQQNAAAGILKREHIIVEMSLDDGNHWAIVEKDYYEVLNDSMGIVFTNPKLELLGSKMVSDTNHNYWEALNGGNLQIRILCAVKSDERLKKFIDNTGDTLPLATTRVFSNDGYKKFIYHPSINDAIYYTKWPPLRPEVDDTSKLEDIANQQAKLTDKATIHGTAVVTFDKIGDWVPGQTISGITGRSITYPVGKLPTIVKVVYDLVAQHCQLALDNHDTALVIQAKAVSDAQNRREAKLGIGALQSTGGNQVPTLPWASDTLSERREGQYGLPD